MPDEDNKRAVAGFVERCQNQHDLEFADEAFHPEFRSASGLCSRRRAPCCSRR